MAVLDETSAEEEADILMDRSDKKKAAAVLDTLV